MTQTNLKIGISLTILKEQFFMPIETSLEQKQTGSIKDEPLMLNLKRRIKHQAIIITISVLFAIPALFVGVPLLVN